MLEVHENEISLRNLSGDTTQLRTFEGTLFTISISCKFPYSWKVQVGLMNSSAENYHLKNP